MRSFGACLMMIVAGAMFASAMADGSTLVTKDKDTYYIHKCQERAYASENIPTDLAATTYDSGSVEMPYRPCGFAGLTLKKKIVTYSNTNGDGHFAINYSPETQKNVLMFFCLIFFCILIALISLRRSLLIGLKKFIFTFYVVMSLAISVVATATIILLFDMRVLALPELTYDILLIFGCIAGLALGILVARLREQPRFAERSNSLPAEKRVQKILEIYYLTAIILLVLSPIIGGLNGLIGMILCGAIIFLPIFLTGILLSHLKKPRVKKVKQPKPRTMV